VVYASVLKATRAELHEKFARWLEGDPQERASELEEIVGYHLERSYELRKELDPAAEGLDALANEAGERLGAAGLWQLNRSDIHGAVDLLRRACRFLAVTSAFRAHVLEALSDAYQLTGDWPNAQASGDESAALAEQLGDEALSGWLQVSQLQQKVFTGKLPADEFVRLSSLVLSGLSGKPSVQATRVKTTVAWAYALAGRYQLAERLIEEVVTSCLHPGDPRKLLPSLWLNGPLRLQEGIMRCEDLLQSVPSLRTAASCYRALAVLRSMTGEYEVAHSFCDRDQEILDELGLRIMRAASTGIRATIYSFAAQPAEAERELRAGIEDLKKCGAALHATGLEAQLARVLLDQGDFREAERMLRPSAANAGEDIAYYVDAIGVRARILVLRGEVEGALALANRGVVLADQTDSPDLRGCARSDLAQVLRSRGAVSEAAEVLSKAIQLFTLKGNLVEAQEAEALLIG
jgi:tetratricopeptide (TPR) repeat protein